MRLVRESTGEEVKTGEVVHDFRGKAAILTSWALPKSPASTGRVYIKEMNERGLTGEYYPSVYGLKWVE